MARKPQSSRDSSRSPRDRLSADLLQNFAADFAINGVGVIQALREKSPERYAELAGKLIMSAEEPTADLDFAGAKSMDEIGEKLLKSIGCEAPTARQIKAAVKLNDKFVKGLEKIGGIVKDDSGWKYQPPSTVGQNGEGLET
jgi:hypothetical protein